MPLGVLDDAVVGVVVVGLGRITYPAIATITISTTINPARIGLETALTDLIANR
jgi:hypothetical protein